MGVSQLFKLCTVGNESETKAWIDSPNKEYLRTPAYVGSRSVTAGGSMAYDYVAQKLEFSLPFEYASEAFRAKIRELAEWAVENGSSLRFKDEDDTWYNVVLPDGLKSLREVSPVGYATLIWHFILNLRER